MNWDALKRQQHTESQLVVSGACLMPWCLCIRIICKTFYKTVNVRPGENASVTALWQSHIEERQVGSTHYICVLKGTNTNSSSIQRSRDTICFSSDMSDMILWVFLNRSEQMLRCHAVLDVWLLQWGDHKALFSVGGILLVTHYSCPLRVRGQNSINQYKVVAIDPLYAEMKHLYPFVFLLSLSSTFYINLMISK